MTFRVAHIAFVLGMIALVGPARQAPGQAGDARSDALPIGQPSRIEIRPAAIENPTLVREGAFLSNMRGELRRTEIGLVMDFAPDAQTGERLVSMVLERGMTLSAMEQIFQAHDEPIGFVVSGQVFVYHGRNYLLPTRFAITTHAEPERSNPETPGDASGDTPGETPGETGADPAPAGLAGFDDESAVEPTIEGLLDGFDPVAGDEDQPMSPGASGGGSGLREGTMIAQVRGRVLPGPGGELLFTQDTDADPDGESVRAELPPMPLLPCLNVERLEALRLEWGDRLVVSMSGRIFVDAGNPALLPTMYIVELDRSGNLSLGQ